MFAILRDDFASRRRMREATREFFRRGMHCDLLPAQRTRKTQRRWLAN